MAERDRLDNSGAIRLTPTQDQYSRNLLEALNSQPHIAFVIAGLSGVGKSSLITSLSPRINQLGGVSVEARDLSYRADEVAHAKHLVTTATPQELERVTETVQKRLKQYALMVSVLPAMSSDEINRYISGLANRGATLSKGDIATYSLGVPLLASRLTFHGLNDVLAAKIGAGYLRSSSGAEMRGGEPQDLNQYLRMPIPLKTRHALEEITQNWTLQHVYDYLNVALAEREELSKRGVQEESPLFVAKESEDIYDKTLQSDGVAGIEIVVPELDNQDLARLQQAFGFTNWGNYNQSEATRAGMFPLTYRKVWFWHKDRYGQEYQPRDSHDRGYTERAMPMLENFRVGKYPLKSKGEGGSFIVHTHDHQGMVYNPAMVGWAVESLLQQRGIGYITNNETLGKVYVYQPDRKRIQLVK